MEQDYDQEALEDSSSLEVSESVPEDIPQAGDGAPVDLDAAAASFENQDGMAHKSVFRGVA